MCVCIRTNGNVDKIAHFYWPYGHLPLGYGKRISLLQTEKATYRYVGNTVITNTNQITFIPHCVRMRQ